MPQERDSQFPMPTAAEVEAMPGDPATKAARNLMVRRIPGIPRRGFLMGTSDGSPILQGLAEFTGAVLDLLDELESEDVDTATNRKAQAVRAMMLHHGCTDSDKQ